MTEAIDDLKSLEDYAHARNVLFSSDAMRYFRAHAGADEMGTLDALIADAKASYPAEDGWVVINLDRITALLTDDIAPAAEPAPAGIIGGGSLAEAIVAGNISAAYRLIENRPMVALSEAVAELDAIYRMHQGVASGSVVVSETLKAEVAKHSVEHVKAAIDALTSALDGAYTDETAAVKMAILKAANIFTV